MRSMAVMGVKTSAGGSQNIPEIIVGGVSPGESERDLMDYFYPEDTRTMFLRKEEQMLQHDKKNNKTSSTNKKQ